MKWYNPYLRYLYENGCILGGSFSEPTEFLPERPHHWCPGGNYFSSAFCISATQTLFSSKDLFILRKRRERTCISRKRGKRRGRYRGRESFKQVPCWVSSLIWGLILQPMTSGSRVRCLKDWVPPQTLMCMGISWGSLKNLDSDSVGQGGAWLCISNERHLWYQHPPLVSGPTSSNKIPPYYSGLWAY